MANRFSLDAVISPTIDDRAVDREVSDMQSSFEDGIGDVGVDGLGGARGAAGGGGGGGVAGGAGLLSGIGGTVGKAAAPVALAGATAFGMLQGIQKLAEASPALQQTFSMFDSAMDLFFRPFGNFLANKLRPWAEASINMATQFNKLAGEEGLAVATGTISAKIVKGGAATFGERVGERFQSDEGMGLLETWLEDATSTDTFGNRLQESFASEMGLEEPLIDVPKLTNDLKNDIVDAWPGWPDLKKKWQSIGGFPDVRQEWMNLGGFPDVHNEWTSMGGFPDVRNAWDGWPDVSLPRDFWPDLSLEDVLDALTGGGNGRGRSPTSTTGRQSNPNVPVQYRNDGTNTSEEELRRNRRTNEDIVSEVQRLRQVIASGEVLDPFLSR